MDTFICENVFVPLRSGPSHKSEMLSQVVFGEKYVIEESAGSWIKIHTLFDDYSGWIDTAHLQQSPADDSVSGHVLNRSLLCFREDETKMVLEAGSEIYYPDFEKKEFFTGKNRYRASADFDRNYVTVNESYSDTGLRYINSPYIWGGRIPSGIDCSGFTQLVYKIHGKAIQRDSGRQAEEGRIVEFILDAQPGDLVFFDNENKKITHVGMILAKGLVIHASGRVRIDTIDHQGIFKRETGKYSHKLRMIRRLSE